jgi:hypothetical protein
VGEHPHGAGQVGAGRGQPVGVAHGAPGVRLAHDQAVALQPGQALREDVGRDAVEQRLQVAEAARPGQQDCLCVFT